ncbi:MAG: prolyl oligopeptidase family serine peptidase [Robiginitomaculum sp.]
MIKSILKSALLGTACAMASFSIAPATANAEVPLEVYAELARTASVRVSPDGKHVAMISPHNGAKKIFIYDLIDPNAKTIVIPTPKNSIIKYIDWASSDHVVMLARFPRANQRRGARKYKNLVSRWVSTNIQTRSSVVLLDDKINVGAKTRGQTGGGTSRDSGGGFSHNLPNDPSHVQMSWGEYSGKPYLRHLKVNLDTGKSSLLRSLPIDTGSVLQSVDGATIYARSEYSSRTGKYSVLAPNADGRFTEIWTKTYDPLTGVEGGLYGVTDDKSKAIFADVTTERLTLTTIDLSTGAQAPYNLDLSEVPSGADYSPINDSVTGEIVGVSYVSDFGGQIFFNAPYKAWHRKAKKTFPGKHVSILSRSEDNSKVTLHVSSPNDAGEFFLFEPKQGQISSLGKSYPELRSSDLANTMRADFSARDGMRIPAYLMLPAGKTKADGPFSLIAMPHGGPQARDTASFDFWSQFLTSRGYAVFKPQFRGSAGFGRAHIMAGRGEFGGKMLDDTVDGVQHLIDTGVVNPDKICVNGASYGGYQAMALPVHSPDMFKCALSVAGVSDLPRMFKFTVDTSGRTSGTVKYWNQVMGDRHEEKDKLDMQSPAQHVDKIKAAMLLVHGENDVTVPFEQTEFMSKALKKAGRSDYKIMTLVADDHHLSHAKSRRELLQASEEFFAKYLK